MIIEVHRRRFLQSSALAAASLVRGTWAATVATKAALVDTHVYCGHWPLRGLAVATPAQLAKSLRRTTVTQAWIGSFEGLFHKDIHGVNARLADACSSVENGLLMPVGTVNPALPDWEEDLRRCARTFGMRGIRLHPTYHGYGLDDSRVAELLRLAAKQNLFVQLVASLPVTESRMLYPRVTNADLSRLAEVVRPIRGLRLLVAGVRVGAENRWPELGPKTFVEMNAGDLVELRSFAKRYSTSRVVVGSMAPLVDTTVADLAQRVANDNLKLESLTHGSAERFLSGT
jgi:uncharacterized protein